MKERFGASVEWLPFDLHPEYPPEGVPRNPERAARAAALFESHGLTYNPPPIAPRSLDAQRLGEHARTQDLYTPFFERTMDAYWAEAQDIGDHDVLRTLARRGRRRRSRRRPDVGPVRRGRSPVDRRGACDRDHGIPAFLLDRRLLVLGAHPHETFERAFEQLRG